MASAGYVNSLLNALESTTKAVLKQVFDYALENLQYGPMDTTKPKAINFRLYRFDATTSSVANQEFSVQHGLNQTPYNLFPVVPLSAVGGRLVRLQVTRAADAQRVYLSSPDTSASISLMLEV